jgi:DNA-binding MurR/RpiR family transcriptional regulator
MSLEARIYAAYSDLSPTERRLANVLLQHQMDLPSYTASELAEKAAVSKATAARLIRTLGYETYGAAKRQIRNARHWGSPLAGLADPDTPPAGAVSLGEIVRMDIDNIRTTAESIPQAALDEAVDAIARARRLWVLGLRSGYGLAHQASHYFTLVKPDVQVLPTGGGTYAHDIASITEGDVLLVVAFRRRPRILPPLLRAAREIGATTILITDISAAASAKEADLVFRCRCQSPAPFNTFSAALTLINYLAWATSTALSEISFDRFQRVDSLVEILDNVSTPKGSRRA